MAFLITLLSALISFNSFSFSTDKYSATALNGWTENPSMFGSDVIMTSPIVAQVLPVNIFFKAIKKKLAAKDAKNFIEEDFKAYCKRENLNHTAINNRELKIKGKTIYMLESSVITKQITKKMIFVILMNDMYLYGHYDGASKVFDRYYTDVLKIIETIKIK